MLERLYLYALSHTAEFGGALGRHLALAATALGLAMLLAVPLGIWTARSRGAALVIINTSNALRVVPSLAILFLAIPYFGLTFTSSIIALTILALPPVLLNTDAAFRTLEPAMLEAATAMGMTRLQRLWRVEAPLALPVVIAGIRTATVEVIASATLAAFIGAGGLGIYITRGFALYDTAILLFGAIPVTLLALFAELLLARLQRAADVYARREA